MIGEDQEARRIWIRRRMWFDAHVLGEHGERKVIDCVFIVVKSGINPLRMMIRRLNSRRQILPLYPSIVAYVLVCV